MSVVNYMSPLYIDVTFIIMCHLFTDAVHKIMSCVYSKPLTDDKCRHHELQNQIERALKSYALQLYKR